MVVDGEDDPKPAPAGNVPAGETTAETPTEPEPEGEQPEAEATEAEATADEELVGEVDEEPDDEGEDSGSEEQKKSRNQRMREQRDRLRAENEALRARASGDVPSDAAQLQRAFEYEVWQQIGDPPNQQQYPDDYVGFNNARQAWETDRRLVTRQVRENFKQKIEREQERVSNLIADHKERETRFKTRQKDYSEVMARATLPVAHHVERLLLESKKSERLGYYLAKDQSKLARLNRMSPEAAAREIGRLEGRLSLPANPKTQTQARKPITPLKGGGASPPSQTQSMNAYLKKLYGDRL